jgi:GLPGLI family protein
MKILSFFFGILSVAPHNLASQNFTGTFKFEEKTNLHRTLGKSNPDFLQYMPEFRSNFKLMAIKNNTSVYVNGEEEQNMSINRGDGLVNMTFKMPENILFKNYQTGEIVEEREFMGKKFLIEGDKKDFTWKITGKMKSILDFPCIEAMYSDTSQTILAYFTAAIPLQGGPQMYGGLPGLILEVNVNNGERLITAISLDSNEPTVPVQKPDKGKKMNREEFDQMVKERMEEMQSTGGGGGIRIMMGSPRN